MLSDFTWNKFIYKYVILPYDWLSWKEAELYCSESETGNLASLNSEEDVKNLTRYIMVCQQEVTVSRGNLILAD